MAIIWPYPSSPSSYASAGQRVVVPPQRCPSCLRGLIGWGGYWRWLRAPLLVERIWIRHGRCPASGVSAIARAAAGPGPLVRLLPTEGSAPTYRGRLVSRLVRYRARAEACNRCPLKTGRTDSMDGREVTRSLDPWLETEIGRFHPRLSLVLVGLSALIVTVALIRNHDDADADALVLGPTLLAVAMFAWRRLLVLLPQPPPAATRSVRR